MVLSLFDAFSIFSTRCTVKNRYFYREKWDLAVFLLFFADFGPQYGVLEPSLDCKKVSRVVPEQVPGSFGPV